MEQKDEVLILSINDLREHSARSDYFDGPENQPCTFDDSGTGW